MNRRGFLGALAAAMLLDPERALWVPGKKLISIPAPPAETAISIMMRRHLTSSGQWITRFDVLYGFGDRRRDYSVSVWDEPFTFKLSA